MKITNLTKIIMIVVAMMLVLSLFACDNNKNDETNAPDNVTTEPDGGDTTEPDGGDTTEPDGGDTTESGSDETDPLPCQHQEETVAAVAPTCTETGLTEGKKCSVCGEVLTAQEDVAALGHTATYTTYVANEESDVAMISGTCSVCNETVTKPASFFYAIESVYGNAGTEGLTVFQATPDGNPAPIMGGAYLNFAEGYTFYPADGFSPISLECTAYDGAFNGMLGVQGWGGYLNGAVTDGAAYKILDAEGNVLVDWTAIQPYLGAVNTARPDVAELLATLYTDGATEAMGFAHIIDFKPYTATLGGKTVNVVLAFTTAQGVDGDVYIPYATLQVNVPACEHTAGEADAADNCNVKCTTCGATLEEGKHTFGEWALDLTAPQQDASVCSVCGAKETRPATTTLEGLTLLSPEYLASCGVDARLESVTVVTEDSGFKYYHAVSKSEGAEATLVFNSGEEAMMGVANYVGILIRKTGNLDSIQCWVNYAGRANHLGEDGKQSAINPTLPIRPNGEWQLIIFDFSSNDIMSAENGIGWARLDICNSTITTVEEIDIAFVGFFSSPEAVNDYYAAYIQGYGLDCAHVPNGIEHPSETVEGKVAMNCTVCGKECNIVDCAHNLTTDWEAGETEGYRGGTCSLCNSTINSKIQFIANFDAQNCTINGEKNIVVTTNVRKEGEPLVVDASALTLNAADSLAVGGWCITPAGIAAYKIRVVSINGEAVAEPTLVEWHNGGNTPPENGITQVGIGKGWSVDCGIGAGWQKPIAMSFAGYEGSTICIELVAVTTYGSQFVFAQINNIAVPAN